MFWWNKKKEVKENVVNHSQKFAVTNDEPPEDPQSQLENNKNEKQENSPEYIWVEGYKGTDKNMCCRDTQYELNGIYELEAEPKTCENGFHFCINLEDVFNYYDLEHDSRFFKVKALVSKCEYERVIKIYNIGYQDSKITSKRIVFLKELNFKELYPYLSTTKYEYIKTEEQYKEFKKDCKLFMRNLFISKMKECNFGENFANIYYDYIISSLSWYNTKDLLNQCKYKLKTAQAYTEEGLSKEMIVYLLMK